MGSCSFVPPLTHLWLLRSAGTSPGLYSFAVSDKAPQTLGLLEQLRRTCFPPLLPGSCSHPHPSATEEFPNLDRLTQHWLRGHHSSWATFWAPQPPSHSSFWSLCSLKNRQHLAQPGHPPPAGTEEKGRTKPPRSPKQNTPRKN